MKISNENMVKLRKNLSDADALVEQGKVDEILDELDREMLFELMDSNDEPSDRWYEMQDVYDNICVEN